MPLANALLASGSMVLSILLYFGFRLERKNEIQKKKKESTRHKKIASFESRGNLYSLPWSK